MRIPKALSELINRLCGKSKQTRRVSFWQMLAFFSLASLLIQLAMANDSHNILGDQQNPLLTLLDGRGTLSFLTELRLINTDVAEIEDRDSGTYRDVYIDTLEFELNLALSPYLNAQIVAGIENIGKKDDHLNAFLDEAVMVLEHPDWPAYLIGGKRTQPFGVFEDHLFNGTLTEDLYEIIAFGGTLGLKPNNAWWDLSVSLYQGQAIIANLNDFGVHEFREDRKRKNDKTAYTTYLRLTPFEDLLTFSSFYQNEPGDGRRNQSIGAALTIEAMEFALDGEHIRALSREDGVDEQENKERAWTLGLAYQGFEPLELAIRYEIFDDDQAGEQDEVIKNRYLAGFNYDFSDQISLSLEYRHTRFEREQESEAASQQNEIELQLAIEF